MSRDTKTIVLNVNGPLKEFAGSITSILQVANRSASQIKTIILSSKRQARLESIENVFVGKSGDLSRVYLTDLSFASIAQNWKSGFLLLVYLLKAEFVIQKLRNSSDNKSIIVENNDIWCVRQDILTIRSSFSCFYKLSFKNRIPNRFRRFLIILLDMKSFIIKNLEKSYFKYHRYKKVIVVSNFLKGCILELYGQYIKNPDDIVVIHNGVDKSISEIRQSRLSATKSKKIKIVFVGRNLERKNLIGLFEIILGLSSDHKDAIELSLIGNTTSEIKKHLHTNNKSADLLETLKVKIIPPNKKVVQILSNSHILIVPSKYDGFAKVVTEGMGTGCCVIASDNCGSAELIRNGETGFVYQTNNYLEASNLLSHLLIHKEVIDICGTKAKKAVISGEIPSWDDIANRRILLYNEIRNKYLRA